MWARYRRTFEGMQLFIWAVAVAALFLFGLMPATLFFVVMQLSAVIGALWATRLSAMVESRQKALPLRAAR
jgi:hypothetical protein